VQNFGYYFYESAVDLAALHRRHDRFDGIVTEKHKTRRMSFSKHPHTESARSVAA
jgi:hypothetical protein